MQNKKETEILVFRKYKPQLFMFTVFAVVFSIDFITTVLALNLTRFEGMFYEMNPVVAWFQSFGVVGYIGTFIWSMVMIYFLSWGVCKLLKKIKNLDYKVNLYIFTLILFVLIEGSVAYSNLMLMLGVGG